MYSLQWIASSSVLLFLGAGRHVLNRFVLYLATCCRQGEGDSGGGSAELATGLPQMFTQEFVSRGPPMPPGLAAMLLPYFLPLLILRIQQQIWQACRRVRLNVVGKAVRLVVARRRNAGGSWGGHC
eukprot:1645905-Pleurochrysis_carterae.AAC.2